MDYKIFGDYITLQALLKDLGIIPSGGAIKAFLANTDIYFNGELEKRRGKKIRVGDHLTIPSQSLTITCLAPSSAEQAQYQEEQKEKKRVAALVKELNQKQKKVPVKARKAQKPIKFPGT